MVFEKERLTFSIMDQPDTEFRIEIRMESGADQQSIWRVNRTAFPTDAEANVVDALREGSFSEVSLVAEVNEKIIGHILFSQLLIVSAAGNTKALSLAPMAVLPEYQRKGVGSRMVSEGLKACRRGGHTIVFVLGHPEFYPRFGFSSELAQPVSCPFGEGEAWMAIELVPGSLTNVKGEVQYPPPFSQLD